MMNSHGELAAIRTDLGYVNQQLRDTRWARKRVSLTLLREGFTPDEVRLKAGVSWHVLELWIEEDPDLPRIVREVVSREADVNRQKNIDLKLKRRAMRGVQPQNRLDGAYRLKVEELTRMKREWEEAHCEKCEPYSQHSSDQIDALQGLVDYW